VVGLFSGYVMTSVMTIKWIHIEYCLYTIAVPLCMSLDRKYVFPLLYVDLLS